MGKIQYFKIHHEAQYFAKNFLNKKDINIKSQHDFDFLKNIFQKRLNTHLNNISNRKRYRNYKNLPLILEQIHYDAMMLYEIIAGHHLTFNLLMDGKNLGRKIKNKIQHQGNISYMRFEGFISGQSNKVIQEYRAHSSIHSNVPKLHLVQNDISTYFCDIQPENKRIVINGYVDNRNQSLLLDPEKIEAYNELFQLNPNTKLGKVYCRSTDSEAKMIHTLLNNTNNKELSGEILIFTYYKPCLSCERKISDFMRIMPNVDIEIIYVDGYGRN